MLGSIGGILSGAGAIAGAFGKGESGSGQQFSESGYKFDDEQKKQIASTLMELFPRIGEQASRPYVGQLFRRGVDETDTDPVFGSQRRVKWAGEMDKLREMIAQQEGSGNASGRQSSGPLRIIGRTEAAAKGGAPGYFLLSDGTKVLEQNFDPQKLEGFDKHRGMVQDYVGLSYGDTAPMQDPATKQGIQANVQDLLKKMMEK
jgi:hypothetical protein